MLKSEAYDEKDGDDFDTDEDEGNKTSGLFQNLTISESTSRNEGVGGGVGKGLAKSRDKASGRSSVGYMDIKL